MLYSSSNFLQSIFTTPSMYSTLLQYSMRFLPRKLAPACDVITLWKRSEIIQRNSNGLHRVQEQVQRRGYPWSVSSKEYMPFIIRSQLRGKWIKEYAKIKMKKGCGRLDALYEVYTLCVCGELEICKERVRRQLSFLFVQWMAMTYRKDPQPDPRLLNPVESKLQRLLAHCRNVCSSLKVLRLPTILQEGEEDPYVKALEKYLKMFESDAPFQFCHLVVPNECGNITKLKFLRAPTSMNEEILEQEDVAGEEQSGSRRNNQPQRFDPCWMLTAKEKRIVQLQEISGTVWEKARQSNGFVEQSKALMFG